MDELGTLELITWKVPGHLTCLDCRHRWVRPRRSNPTHQVARIQSNQICRKQIFFIRESLFNYVVQNLSIIEQWTPTYTLLRKSLYFLKENLYIVDISHTPYLATLSCQRSSRMTDNIKFSVVYTLAELSLRCSWHFTISLLHETIWVWMSILTMYFFPHQRF